MSRKIKSTKIFKYDYHLIDAWESEIDLEPYLFNEIEYDEFGNIVMEVTHNADYSTTSKSNRKFDENGWLTEEILWDENDEIMERTTYNRDTEGRILSQLEHYLDGSYDTTEFEYDENGNIVRKTTINDDNETEGHETFLYENGKLIKTEEFDDEDKLISGNEYEYDENGNNTVQISRTLEGGYVKIVSEFDENNYRIKQLRYNEIGRLIEKTMYVHDENGRVTEVLEEDEHKKNTTNFTLNEQGNATWQIETDIFGETALRVERIYDNEGNIIKLIAFIKSPGNYPDQNYILSYEYEYFE